MLYAFRLSLENPELSFSELTHLFDAYSVKWKYLRGMRKIFLFECEGDDSEIINIVQRSANTKLAFKIFRMDRADPHRLLSKYREILESTVVDGYKYRLRVYNFNSKYAHGSLRGLESQLADRLFTGKLGSIKISLSEPDVTVSIILIGELSLFGILLIDESRKYFVRRRPSSRPIFSPFSLQPKIARTMVNLTADLSGIITDPFCGVGGILLESCLTGRECIGVDIKSKLVYGAKRNLTWIDQDQNYSHLIIGDACKLPLRRVDYVVTDPPYGRITSTAGRDVHSLYECFLRRVVDTMGDEGKIIFMSSWQTGIPIDKMDQRIEHTEKYVIPVHRSLTRVLHIMRKRSKSD